MGDPIKHVIRPSPPWATGEQVTVCGNLKGPDDMTLKETSDYIRKECRSSVQVAYATCCVTCINNRSRQHHMHSKFDERVGVLVEHWSRLPPRRFPDEMKRRNAEAQAIEIILSENMDQFRQLVDSFTNGLRVVEPLESHGHD